MVSNWNFQRKMFFNVAFLFVFVSFWSGSCLRILGRIMAPRKLVSSLPGTCEQITLSVDVVKLQILIFDFELLLLYYHTDFELSVSFN